MHVLKFLMFRPIFDLGIFNPLLLAFVLVNILLDTFLPMMPLHYPVMPIGDDLSGVSINVDAFQLD